MKFVRAATIEEVLRASPEDEATRDIVRACPDSAFGLSIARTSVTSGFS